MAKSKLSFKQAYEELTQILEGLQTQDVDVDVLVSKVKRATELIKFCREKITQTESQVKKIIEEFESAS